MKGPARSYVILPPSRASERCSIFYYLGKRMANLCQQMLKTKDGIDLARTNIYNYLCPCAHPPLSVHPSVHVCPSIRRRRMFLSVHTSSSVRPSTSGVKGVAHMFSMLVFSFCFLGCFEHRSSAAVVGYHSAPSYVASDPDPRCGTKRATAKHRQQLCRQP